MTERRLSRRVLFQVALMLAGLVACSIAIEARPPTAKLDFKLPKTTTLGEPAIMTAQLYNNSGYRLVVDFGVEDQTQFVFSHARPDGTTVRVAPAIPPPNRQRTSHLMLRDTAYTASVVLDRWLDLSQTGRHTIDVEFHGAAQIDGGDPAGLRRAAKLVIDVKPRDAARLEKRGGEWLKQISTLSPGSDARTAASALVVMTDPVAIPYLELAATRTRSPQFIDAIAAMRNPKAREALERLAQSKDEDVRSLALKALAGRLS